MESFSQKTKKPLAEIHNFSPCCDRAELFGMLLFAGSITPDYIRINSESLHTAERFCYLLDSLFGFKASAEKEGRHFSVICTEKGIVAKCLYSLRLSENNIMFCITEDIVKKDCCKRAFLRGAFLGGGIVIDPNKNYNMEFLTRYNLLTDDFLSFLKNLGFEFKKVYRKGFWVVYTKVSDTICDVLSFIGSTSSMDYINVKIEREIRNNFTRASNGETANMDKVLTASAKQIAAINKIRETIGFGGISEELAILCTLRLKNRDLSLDALGTLLTPPLSKSGVNHRMKRILKIAENL